MKIGYACINNSIGCTANTTFRLASYSEENLIQKVENNLNCLMKILKWNVENKIYFFRISSDLVPFASHPVCKFDWGKHFEKKFQEIGDFIKKNDIRISMHPDQFVLINAMDEKIVERSFSELEYHAKVLDLMGLDETAKIQIHVGGVYGDKDEAIKRFVESYKRLSDSIKRRLVIENEERLYSLKDCLRLHEKTGVPILFDFFHHSLFNNKESFSDAVKSVSKTWKKHDGIPMTDYSSQKEDGRFGAHTASIDLKDFEKVMKEAKMAKIDFDVILEIKDKEKSCLKAISSLNAL
ncbi:UV DNA damage repair endonuclease UvsE [Candidatus Pacearchaeota archaeon]|nr:UV DNA damage repair endonuclease UvsE [Candidatus Pacearchaeota archaeon]